MTDTPQVLHVAARIYEALGKYETKFGSFSVFLARAAAKGYEETINGVLLQPPVDQELEDLLS